MRLAKLATIASIGALGLGAATASSASAVTIVAGHPSDPSIAEYHSTGSGVRACDNQVDGHRVRAWARAGGGDGNPITDWAPSGGCSTWNPVNIAWLRVCVEDEGCGPWRN